MKTPKVTHYAKLAECKKYYEEYYQLKGLTFNQIFRIKQALIDLRMDFHKHMKAHEKEGSKESARIYKAWIEEITEVIIAINEKTM